MLDDLDRLAAADTSGFFQQLSALPASYQGPEGRQAEPYGLLAFGEAAGLESIVRPWIDYPLVPTGTQFIIAAGFDYGDVATTKLSSEHVGAKVIVMGHDAYKPDYQVDPGVLSSYHYLHYLGYATGNHTALDAAETAMLALRDACAPHQATENNPAKTLAWSLWNRVPLLLSSRSNGSLPAWLQQLFARVGKTLAISLPVHPLETLAGAFEARHALGDDVVALIIGDEDEEMQLAREVLTTRIAQVERLDLPFQAIGQPLSHPVARALALWYATLWVTAYLSILQQQSPNDSEVYQALCRAANADALHPDAIGRDVASDL